MGRREDGWAGGKEGGRDREGRDGGGKNHLLKDNKCEQITSTYICQPCAWYTIRQFEW